MLLPVPLLCRMNHSENIDKVLLELHLKQQLCLMDNFKSTPASAIFQFHQLSSSCDADRQKYGQDYVFVLRFMSITLTK
jgi:hypothetical protein